MDLIAAWNVDEFAAEFVREVERYLAKVVAFQQFCEKEEAA